MSSWIKGLAAGGGSAGGSSGGAKGKQGGQASPSFFNKTNDKKSSSGNSSNKESDSGFTQKMFAYGKDVQSKRDQQRKEQELIDKKMAKRGVKPNKKADVPTNGPSKTKILTTVLGKK